MAQRKRREKSAREHADRYRSFFEHALEGIFRSTPEGRFVEVNPALVRMLGYQSAEEVLALKLPDDLYVDPPQRAHLRARYEPAGVIEGVELLWKKKNGEQIIVSLYARAIRNARGHVVAYEGLVLEVTARKRAEEALRASEARYRNLFENANDMIATFTLDGTITSVNRGLEVTLGWFWEELIGQHYSKLATPAALALADERTRRALAGEELPSIFEAEIVRKDGRVVPIEVRSRFIRDVAGQPIGVQGIFRDLAERKRAEAAVLAERMREPALTPRELEVLQLLIAGKSNKEIGATLFLSASTVKTHLSHLFGKLGVGDRTQAVTTALKRGLVQLE